MTVETNSEPGNTETLPETNPSNTFLVKTENMNPRQLMWYDTFTITFAILAALLTLFGIYYAFTTVEVKDPYPAIYTFITIPVALVAVMSIITYRNNIRLIGIAASAVVVGSSLFTIGYTFLVSH